MTRARVPVIVTGVGGGAYGEQILKALRLATTPYEIIAADMNPNSKGFGAADQRALLPAAKSDDYVDALLALARATRAVAIFPGSEPELAVLSRHRDAIRAAGVFLPIDRAEVIDVCLDKARTFEFLAARGFPVPAWRRVREPADVNSAVPLPAVLKPARGGGGSANVFLAQRERDLRAFAEYLLDVTDELVVQEYVGDPQSEYTVGVLFDMEGRFINSIAVHRDLSGALSTRIRAPNRTARVDLGPTLVISSGVSQGVVGPFRDVTAPVEAIASALGCQGAVNVQCRVVRGDPYVFEINPRFSGTTSVRALVGYNEPDVLVRRHVLGEDVPERFPYRSGRVLRGLTETLVDLEADSDAR